MKPKYIIDNYKLKNMKDFDGIRIGVNNHILEITKRGFTIWRNGFWLIDGSLFLEDGEIRITDKVEEIGKTDDRRIFKFHIDLEKEIKEKEKELKALKKEYNKETIEVLEKEK